MHKYIIFQGHSWLGLEMGRYPFFLKIDTISIFSLKISAINLVSVYSWYRRQVGLYNKRVPRDEFSSVRFYRAMHCSAKRGIEIACRPSVWQCLSVCNVGGSGSSIRAHRLEILKTNCTDNLPNTFALRSPKQTRRLKITEKTELGLQWLPKFMRCLQLSQERLKLYCCE